MVAKTLQLLLKAQKARIQHSSKETVHLLKKITYNFDVSVSIYPWTLDSEYTKRTNQDTHTRHPRPADNSRHPIIDISRHATHNSRHMTAKFLHQASFPV